MNKIMNVYFLHLINVSEIYSRDLMGFVLSFSTASNRVGVYFFFISNSKGQFHDEQEFPPRSSLHGYFLDEAVFLGKRRHRFRLVALFQDNVGGTVWCQEVGQLGNQLVRHVAAVVAPRPSGLDVLGIKAVAVLFITGCDIGWVAQDEVHLRLQGVKALQQVALDDLDSAIDLVFELCGLGGLAGVSIDVTADEKASGPQSRAQTGRYHTGPGADFQAQNRSHTGSYFFQVTF